MALADTLLLANLGLLLVVLVLVVLTLARTGEDGPEFETDQLSSALSRSLDAADFKRNLTLIEERATEIQRLHADLDEMLRTPQRRGQFGEVQLELLLEDHLPPTLYGLRKAVVGNKIPDAYIESSSGHICIDAKFPLDNYERSLDADGPEADRYSAQFGEDVRRQLEEVATKYVRPQEGTAEFAFAFVPSESAYYHLVTEEYELLREFSRRGVQVVSPLTLGHKLELIKADVRTQQLSEQAKRIRDEIASLGDRFDEVEGEWETLRRHVRNASNKAQDVDREFDSLRSEFERVTEPVERER